jgi:hypothetical protein
MLARVSWRPEMFVLASMHHERTDGSGYFRGTNASAQPYAARLLATADTYQAMTEPRPHRAPLERNQAIDELAQEVRAGRIDAKAAEAVLEVAGDRNRRRRPHVAGLTTREVEVLRLIARGLSTREIAMELTISPKTAIGGRGMPTTIFVRPGGEIGEIWVGALDAGTLQQLVADNSASSSEPAERRASARG